MLEEARARMQKAVEHLKVELAQIRTGRATPALIEKVAIEVYGGSQKLTIEELGQITAPDPHQLVIDPWDKSIVSEIAGGIAKANLNLTPVVDGEIIRIDIPLPTAEKRREIVKSMHQKLEVYRVEIRQIRHELLEELRKKREGASFLGEDEEKRLERQLQELVDEFIEQIDLAGEAKAKELLSV